MAWMEVEKSNSIKVCEILNVDRLDTEQANNYHPANGSVRR